MSESKLNQILECTKPSLQQLGAELLGPKYSVELEGSMVETYHELSIVIAFRELTDADYPVDLDDIEYFGTLWLRIQHRLSTFSAMCSVKDSDRGVSDVQNICRLVVPLCVVQIHLGLLYCSAAAIESFNEQLWEVLNHLDLGHCWREYTELMTWAFFFGVSTSPGSARRQWFLFELVKGAKNRIEWRRPALRMVMQRFFYVDRMHEADFKKITDEARPLMDFAGYLKLP